MKCPKCGNDDDKVLDSRSSKEGAVVRRRRECLKCGHRFTTHEEIDRDDLFVVKRDGRREVFQREKLEKSVRIACQKRPIPEAKVQDLIGGVMQTLGAAAAGIIVAVSVQVMYGVLRVRLDRLTADLEAAASEILGILAAHREAAA